MGVLSIAVLAMGYTWLSHRQHAANPDDRTIPTWSQLAEGVQKTVTPQPISGEVWLSRDVQATYSRLGLGLLTGAGLGVAIGLGMGCFAPLEALLLPPIAAIAKIPPTAMLAVFFVLVGTQTEFYVAMIAFGVTPILAQSLYRACRDDVPDELLQKAATLGASTPELVWNVVFKQVMPRLIEAVRLQIGPAMVFLIAAEYAAADAGFGYRLRIEARKVNFDVVYFYLALLAASGFLFDALLTQLRRRLCPWFEDARTA
ncbi:MAG: ABC transporter permease subunit [Planctomycetota bacterium]